MQLGDYVLLKQLGAGPDGAAYAARHATTGEPLEVQVLSRLRRQPERHREVARRLSALAMVTAPSVRRLLAWQTETEHVYLAIPPLGSATLADLIAAGPLPVDRAVRLTLHLANGLVEAHRLGLVHGALSPATLALASDRTPVLDLCGTRVSPNPNGRSLFDRACRAPELEEHAPDAAADMFALGTVLAELLTAKAVTLADDIERVAPGEVAEMVRAMRDERPWWRPTAAEVAEQLARLEGETARTAPDLPAFSATLAATPGPPEAGVSGVGEALAPEAPVGPSAGTSGSVKRLGRYTLLDCLGRGGMGEVYRAEDLTDGKIVAIKVLTESWADRPEALARFRKEARLLAEVRNPWVSNLIEVNQDQGVHFIVVEYVRGRALADVLDERGRLSEVEACSIVADVARALADAHRRGIVHRDVKPGNVLLDEEHPGGPGRVRLVDFGIARQVEQSESMALTQAGAALGTPWYMAPEQCLSNTVVGPSADVYAMGATLFHLIAGRPPFDAKETLQIMLKHVREAPPRLLEVAPGVSPEVSAVVARALAKEPEARFADAVTMLDALDAILAREGALAPAVAIDSHPRLPPHEPSRLRNFDFEWHLKSTPEELWPFVANTDRLNRAVGLKPVRFSVEPHGGAAPSWEARSKVAGLEVRWREHPFEWIEGRRFTILREFPKGPLTWYVTEVTLTPKPDGGTRLSQSVHVLPRNVVGRLVAALQVGRSLKKHLDKLYPRIDALIQGSARGRALADPFEPTAALTNAAQDRLLAGLARVGAAGVPELAVEALGKFLREASSQELARIRPLALARRFELDEASLIDACLVGAKEGLLVLMWDILCPSCQVPSEVMESLRHLEEHGRCDVCAIDFELDFAGAVELIFRAHPAIRHTELQTFCLGGPANAPHVASQIRLDAGERMLLTLALDEGSYRLRSPQLDESWDFKVGTPAEAARVDLRLGGAGLPAGLPHVMTGGVQLLDLTNAGETPILVRVERRAPREDALTAARACTMARFRHLFPNEVLADGRNVPPVEVAVLVARLAAIDQLFAELGEEAAYTHVRAVLADVRRLVERERGSVIKNVGSGLLAVFDDPAAAARVALEARQHEGLGTRVTMGLDAGLVRLATVDGRLDYFGHVVDRALRLPIARPGGILFGRAVAERADVLGVVEGVSAEPRVVDAGDGSWAVQI